MIILLILGTQYPSTNACDKCCFSSPFLTFQPHSFEFGYRFRVVFDACHLGHLELKTTLNSRDSFAKDDKNSRVLDNSQSNLSIWRRFHDFHGIESLSTMTSIQIIQFIWHSCGKKTLLRWEPCAPEQCDPCRHPSPVGSTKSIAGWKSRLSQTFLRYIDALGYTWILWEKKSVPQIPRPCFYTKVKGEQIP